MSTTQRSRDIRSRLDAVIHGETSARIPELVKAVLIDSMLNGELDLPQALKTPRPDTYARRLFHRDPSGQYTMVVMTWGPGQQTALHDHAGIWCVECVVQGRMLVTQYDLIDDRDDRYRFQQKTSVNAERGSAGCLIPPFEYHTLANAVPDGSSITLHVYGGEMDHCHVFERMADGAYRKLTRSLSYHNVE
jgi:3-mercaptopropionate dioxygenase